MTHVSHFIAQKKGVVYKMMFFWGTRDLKKKNVEFCKPCFKKGGTGPYKNWVRPPGWRDLIREIKRGIMHISNDLFLWYACTDQIS